MRQIKFVEMSQFSNFIFDEMTACFCRNEKKSSVKLNFRKNNVLVKRRSAKWRLGQMTFWSNNLSVK
jgi:hypothetical protein